MGGAYYNENEGHAAQWLRNLIGAGLICPGDVDERSIVDVTPDDIRRYDQCHFFAGIGVWSYALRNAGWPDNRKVWTGSCPCQPLSAAGAGKGFTDERHLWPDWFWLIGECQPVAILGEQVASPLGLAWLDLVQSDLEGAGYASGADDICAAGFGAPHIRQRLFWMAYAAQSGRACRDHRSREERVKQIACRGDAAADRNGASGGLADADGACTVEERLQRGGEFGGTGSNSRNCLGHEGQPGPTNGFWHDADWLKCRDGKWRPVEPGTFPLVDGSSFKLGSGSAFEGKSRTGMLRGYGNAINLEVATEFVSAALAVMP